MSRRTTCGVVLLVLATIGWAAPAQAGRVLVTGHDADYHCAQHDLQCHFVRVAVDYARGGAPNPSLPLLVLDRASLHVVTALDKAYGGPVARTVVDPRSQLAGTAISTSAYSAIVVASDKTCGGNPGCDLNELTSTPDSDAINARRADIEAFFNAGGGIVAFAGANHGGNDANTADDAYYRFLPIPVGGALVSPPFSLTADGRSLGFTDGSGGTTDDVNCSPSTCPTHNSFTLPPAGSALRVAESDSAGRAETLFAEGSVAGDNIQTGPPPPRDSTAPPSSPPPVQPAPRKLDRFDPDNPLNPNNTLKASQAFQWPSTKRCVSRRNFKLTFVRPRDVTYVSGRVEVNGRQVPVVVRRVRYRTIRGKVLKLRRFTAQVDLRGLAKGRFRVALTAYTQTLVAVRGVRQYRTCSGKLRGGRPRV